MALARHARDWEDLGTVDPLWAVLTYPQYRFGRWDEAAFFRSGAQEIDDVMRKAETLGCPRRRDSALDFGCGVGRLTRALARHFSECYGVDIAESMVSAASALLPENEACRFLVNRENDLRLFPDERFDMVYSVYVLQHLPTAAEVSAFVREFVRVLRPGGLLAFQALSDVPLPLRLQPRRRLYATLRAMGLSENLVYRRFGLAPIRMTAFSEANVVALLERAGATVLDIERQPIKKRLFDAGPFRIGQFLVGNRVYYVTK